MGDFNAKSQDWGYQKEDIKGRQIREQLEKWELELLTDPTIPTRVGNSVSQDTSPDLTIGRNLTGVSWLNTLNNLGSDHYIISTTIRTRQVKKKIGEAEITDWETFRKRCRGKASQIEDIESWSDTIIRQKQAASKRIATTEETPGIDPHLLHLWAARRGLTKRLKKHKLNTKLKKRIREITEKAQDYANELARSNWNKFCDGLDGTLSTSKTWRILRAIIDPTQTKGANSKAVERLIHTFPGTEADLLKAVTEKCYGTGPPPPKTRMEYTGNPNPTLDAPITLQEVRAAMSEATRNTAPGKDGITYAMIRNLDDTNVEAYTEYINQLWDNGTLPQLWKHAKVILIPKPGKTLDIHNLRPISLTSCLGKVFEKIINTRLKDYLENNNLMPNNMFGFRPKLSAQDVLLQLKEEVLVAPKGKGEHVVMALDIKGAFDNLSHGGILEGLNKINCGCKTFNYIRAFLEERTAEINIGSLTTETLKVPSKGTPQGAVISPTLFNVAMLGLAENLQSIQGMQTALYADDITVWTTTGSLGEKEEKLQRAATMIDNYVTERGMECAPQKSELVRIWVGKGNKAVPTDPAQKLEIQIAGERIKEKTHIRILGMWIQSNRRCSINWHRVKASINQVSRMIRRITNQRTGMREKETIRLIQSLVESRMLYSLPYFHLIKTEREAIEACLRVAYKTALQIPRSAPTDILLAMGISNTFDELMEAQLVAQKVRLAKSRTGQVILRRLGYQDFIQQEEIKKEIPRELRNQIKVAPIPRNMNPGLHAGRRTARARYLQRKHGEETNTLYTDAAPHRTHRNWTTVTVINHDYNEQTSATVLTQSIQDAEEIAIALAIANNTRETETTYILTDSMQACKNYLTGKICMEAVKILNRKQKIGATTLVWTPGHAGVRGNERAHEVASEHSNFQSHPNMQLRIEPSPMPWIRSAYLEWHREVRFKYPPPHKSLTKSEQVAWRKLQTNTYPNLHFLHKINPNIYPDKCPWCGGTPTLDHITWACAGAPKIQNTINTKKTQIVGKGIMDREDWEAVLLSSEEETQRAAILRAEQRAKASGALK